MKQLFICLSLLINTATFSADTPATGAPQKRSWKEKFLCCFARTHISQPPASPRPQTYAVLDTSTPRRIVPRSPYEELALIAAEQTYDPANAYKETDYNKTQHDLLALLERKMVHESDRIKPDGVILSRLKRNYLFIIKTLQIINVLREFDEISYVTYVHPTLMTRPCHHYLSKENVTDQTGCDDIAELCKASLDALSLPHATPLTNCTIIQCKHTRSFLFSEDTTLTPEECKNLPNSGAHFGRTLAIGYFKETPVQQDDKLYKALAALATASLEDANKGNITQDTLLAFLNKHYPEKNPAAKTTYIHVLPNSIAIISAEDEKMIRCLQRRQQLEPTTTYSCITLAPEDKSVTKAAEANREAYALPTTPNSIRHILADSLPTIEPKSSSNTLERLQAILHAHMTAKTTEQAAAATQRMRSRMLLAIEPSQQITMLQGAQIDLCLNAESLELNVHEAEINPRTYPTQHGYTLIITPNSSLKIDFLWAKAIGRVNNYIQTQQEKTNIKSCRALLFYHDIKQFYTKGFLVPENIEADWNSLLKETLKEAYDNPFSKLYGYKELKYVMFAVCCGDKVLIDTSKSNFYTLDNLFKADETY